jgi:hypothetical protein
MIAVLDPHHIDAATSTYVNRASRKRGAPTPSCRPADRIRMAGGRPTGAPAAGNKTPERWPRQRWATSASRAAFSAVLMRGSPGAQ